jgi:tetratricopeptide (TPR) repeat protein
MEKLNHKSLWQNSSLPVGGIETTPPPRLELGVGIVLKPDICSCAIECYNSVISASAPVIPAPHSVIPAPHSVIPAKAGIQKAGAKAMACVVKPSLLFFLIIILSIITFNSAFAKKALHSEFERANQLYLKEDFAGSIQIYESIIKKGYESGELHYNLGNAYYKSGKLGKAILHYERARRYMARDDDLEANLKIAGLRVADKTEIPRLFFWKAYTYIRDFFSLNALSLISLILFLVLLLLLAFYILQPRGILKRLSFYIAVILSIAFLFFAVIFSKRIWRAETIKEAVILAEKVEIVSAPDEGAKGLFALHEGVIVIIKQELPPWAEIMLPDGKRGWVKKEAFEQI